MKILHIGSIGIKQTNGMNVVVPQYVIHQSKLAECYFYNLQDVQITGIDCQIKIGVDALPSFCVDHQIDMVVFHGVYFHQYWLLGSKLYQKRIPYIVIPHGSLTEAAIKQKYLKKKVAFILFLNRFLKHSKQVICLSEGEKNATKMRYLQDKMTVIPNGLEEVKEKKQNFSIDGLRLIFIGRLTVYYKGLDWLCQAIGQIKQFCLEHKISVDLCGPIKPEENGLLEKLIADNGIGEIVKVHPPVIGEEKIKYLLSGDVFIQVSRSEGLPMGLLEALNAGLPCLVTEGTRCKDLVESSDAGWGVDSTPEAIADGIVRAYQERAQWQQKSRYAIVASEPFLWENVTRQAIACYKNWNEAEK